jgi:hypothetical protein
MHFKPINIKRWLIATTVLTALLATAQPATDTVTEPKNQLDVTLQIMARGETRYGGLPSADEEGGSESDNGGNIASSNFIMGRSRLPIHFKRDWLEAQVTPQHNGVWGQAGKGAFNLYEVWAKFEARNGLFAQVGRIALNYDDERIIGSDDWAMASLSHDVLRLGYEGHGHKVHAILAYNQNADVMTSGGNFYSGGAQPYKTMHTLWYHYDVPRFPLGASLLFMNIGMQADKDNIGSFVRDKTIFQHLLGGYVKFTPKHWSVSASYYHQFGHSETNMKIDAWMASGKVTFRPLPPFDITAGFDYLSGDKYFAVPTEGAIGMTHHEVIKGFSTVYGSHHKFYGAMDFFYVTTYLFGFTPGLQNAYIGGSYQPIKGLNLSTSYHYFATATKLEDMGQSLGHEWEFQARYALTRDVAFSAGVSLMWGTETMDRLKRSGNESTLRWGWLSLNINPRIFSIKW